MDNKIQTSIIGVILTSGKQINFQNPENISFNKNLCVKDEVIQEAPLDENNKVTAPLSKVYRSVRSDVPVLIYMGADNTALEIKEEHIAVFLHDKSKLQEWMIKSDLTEVASEDVLEDVLNV